MNQQEQIARLHLKQAEVRAFVAEQHKLSQAVTNEASKLAIGSMIAGAVMFGAGMAFTRLIS